MPEKSSGLIGYDDEFCVYMYFSSKKSDEQYKGTFRITMLKDGKEFCEYKTVLWGNIYEGWTYSYYDTTQEYMCFPEELYNCEVLVKIENIDGNISQHLQDVFFAIGYPPC